MTCLVGTGNELRDKLREAGRIAKRQELNPVESVFLEHVKCVRDFPRQSSIDVITVIAESKSIPLADAFLANAYLHLARGHGDPIAAMPSRDMRGTQ